MSALLRIFDPLRQAATIFFKRDVAVRRDSAGMHIVLEEVLSASTRPPKPSRVEQDDQKQREELAVIVRQLRELLDELPESRQTLRHLVFVEQALGKKGLRALHKLPLDVLQRALEQLEGLVTNWTPVGLANLRSKMAVAVLDREHHDPHAEGDAYRTAAVLDTMPVAKLEVEPVSDADALAAAYAALGDAAPLAGTVQMQPELGARSARAVAAPAMRSADRPDNIALRELHT